MKKVLLCIPTLGTGGAEKFVVDLATRLDKSVFDVTVAITRRNIPGIYEQVLKNHNIPIVDLSGESYLRMLRKQLAYLRKAKPDVVHTSVGSMLHMMLATLLIPVPVKLFTMHNQVEYTFRERKSNRWIYKAAFTLLGYTPVGICDHIARDIQNTFSLPAEKVRKVNNGVDLTVFKPAEREKKKETVEIVNIGTMYGVKNQRMLMEAFGALYRQYPNLRLTILGDGVLRPELESQAERLGISDVVRMPGIQKAVCAYLQQADIYVSASNSEGQPLSVLEAMACGLPVVATAAGGTVDAVKNGENGIIIPIGDQKALEAALQKMITEEEFRKKCGETSYHMAQGWSIEACAEGYAALYNGK